MDALTFEGVDKSYADVQALSDVNISVGRGRLVALLGPNGAGKTTAFELALGLTRPSGGRIRVLGHPPGSRAVMVRLGAMLQNAGMQENVTVAEAVRLIGRSYPRSRAVDDVLKRVGLTGRRDRMLTDLSGGERQRLLLALAIVGAPDLLVLDEPTAAMDVDGRRAFWTEARASVADGTTILFATHDLAEADEVADRVVILRDGRIVADASPYELKRRIHRKVARFVTDVPASILAALIGAGTVASVRANRGDSWRYDVHSDDPAALISSLVTRGCLVADLVVRDAALEDAFVELITDPALATGV